MIYKWHSINLVPTFSYFDIASDDKIDSVHGCYNWDGTIIGRCIEVSIFGIIFNFMYPNTKFKKQHIGKVYGPLWSRRRKQWYRVKEQ